MPFQDLIGQKFGKLTVVARAENNKQNKAMWICKCDCGNMKKKPVSSYEIKSGKVRSCGCLYKGQKNGIKHGWGNTRLWSIWSGMICRCKPSFKESHNYFDRGISVCEEWKTFIPFRDWALSNGYSDELSIDRIDNNKGYSPDNCRWSTMKEQQNNRRNNVRITVNGITHTASEWSEITGIRRETLICRYKSGWNESEMFIAPDLGNRYKRRKNK